MQFVILFAVSIWAGIQNALAGGGTFLMLPALMMTDMSALAANITSTVALFPGQISSSLAGRNHVSGAGGLPFRALFAISLNSEFIANNQPLMVQYDGKYYFPVFVTHTEADFGGEFETAADYRDPYLQKQIAEKNGRIYWAPIRYS